MTRVAVAGLGAVGTVVASRFARAGADVAVVAGGARRERLLSAPTWLNGVELALGEARVRPEPPEEWGDGADLAVVSVKNGDLERAAEDLRPWLKGEGKKTVVLPLLNGITATERLERAYGESAEVLKGLVLCNSAVREGRDVRQSGTFRIRVGGEEGAVRRVLAWLAAAGIDADAPEDMDAAQYEKWLLNVGLNQTEALLGLTHGELAANPDATAFMWALIGEGVELGRALGVSGVEEMPGLIRKALGMLSAEGKSSMLQDVEAGRETEVDAFAGELCRRAAAAGVSSPCNALVLEALGRRGE